jgi:flagellar biosynthesis protein FlhF
MEIDTQIVDFLLKNIDLNRDKDGIRQELEDRLMSIFKPVIPSHHRNKIMAFVGSPGVGKTTTLAKIGAIFSLFNSFNISFITIDTYRVGAIEQMKIYGDIIGASVDVVMSPEELKEAIERNREKDLILIDSTGRPSKNFRQLTELRTFLDVLNFADIYLVINATTQKKDMMHILNDYKIIAYTQLIITKIDETVAPGSIINAAYFTGLPIAYITNGQNVPDDIEVSSPKLLASYVMREVVF